MGRSCRLESCPAGAEFGLHVQISDKNLEELRVLEDTKTYSITCDH
jgi:hypothetical protein